MRRKTEKTARKQPIVRLAGAERLGATLFPAGELRQLLQPLLSGVVTTKRLMRDWVTDFGLAAVTGLMQADAQRVVGARKGAQQAERRFSHWGSTPIRSPTTAERWCCRDRGCAPRTSGRRWRCRLFVSSRASIRWTSG